MQYNGSISKSPEEGDGEEAKKIDWEKAFECINNPQMKFEEEEA